jgi:hypothetical protein
MEERERCYSFILSRTPHDVFHHVVIKIRQLFLQLAACLTSTLLENGVIQLTTENATGTNGLTCLSKHGGARDNKVWSPSYVA